MVPFEFVIMMKAADMITVIPMRAKNSIMISDCPRSIFFVLFCFILLLRTYGCLEGSFFRA